MSIDLDLAEQVFAESQDGTVGLEEEFALLDPATLDMVPRFEELRDSAEDPVLAESISGELISSEIEVRSGRGVDTEDAIARQRDVARRLFAHAAERGVVLSATGTHPWADYRRQPNIDTEHYRRVVDDLQYVARRNNTFSLHAHVGVQGLDRAVRVCDRLRPVLPVLLAVSGNSPYIDGIDSGLHSARSQAFTKSFPRCGIPESYGSWAAYREYLQLLIDMNSIVEYTQVWWSVRPHFSFGTVEVRICDVQATAQESDALARLISGCVLQAVADEDEGARSWGGGAGTAGRLIEENFWRAIRFGMDGRLIDLESRREIEAAAAVEELLQWSAPARAAGRIAEPVFPAQNGAQRQRAMIAQAESIESVFAASVAETQTSYAKEPVLP
ncbi:MAG: YbdK family carboxylate-amine ligase [Baekduia sp.]